MAGVGKLKVEVLTGPQGGGKSTVMRDEALQQPGLYLFALPTIELIDEQSDDFFRARSSIPTEKIHKDSGSGSVAKRLDSARKDFADRGVSHGVIFITHETLMSHDLAGFDGWHARVDEAPAAVQAGEFNLGFTASSWLKESFEIVGAPGSEWSGLRMKTQKPTWKDLEKDEGAQAFREFIKQAAQPDRTFVKTTSWEAKDKIEWFSMWTPLALSDFATVQIAGSSYTDSVGYRAALALFDDRLAFTKREIAPPRKKQPSISVRYFTQGHEGTTAFWGESEGRLCIKKVCDYLAENLSESAYWSGNLVVQHLMEHRLPGRLIKPMAMGINKHRTSADCAFLFSAKATPQDGALKSVFNLTDDDIRHAREDDAVAQFIMRGAIRDLDYGGPYAVYLYSQSQAERLRDHLLRIKFTTVDVVPLVEAGLMDEVRVTRKRKEATPEELAARAERRREKAKLRMRKNRAEEKAEKEAATPPK